MGPAPAETPCGFFVVGCVRNEPGTRGPIGAHTPNTMTSVPLIVSSDRGVHFPNPLPIIGVIGLKALG